jgi:hypothetical protein
MSKKTFLIFCLFIVSFSALFGQLGIPDFKRIIVLFGQIASKDYPTKGNPYLETSILVESSPGPLRVPGGSKVLYVQHIDTASSVIAASMPGMIAVSQEDNLVSIYSGNDLIPSQNISYSDAETIIGILGNKVRAASPYYFLRVYDSKNKAWLNPVLFAPSLEDRGSPQIDEIILQGKDKAYRYQKSLKNRSRIPQGRYILELGVEDIVRTNSVSGLYHFRVILDGSVIIEKKLDSASANERGLSFFGFTPPSSKAVGINNFLNVGEISLLRGLHNLEIIVADYAGNTTSVPWSITVE